MPDDTMAMPPRLPIRQAQARAYRHYRDWMDRQPHMTLTPVEPWRGGDRQGYPGQRSTLLSAAEAFCQGFHAGARWGRQDAIRRRTR